MSPIPPLARVAFATVFALHAALADAQAFRIEVEAPEALRTLLARHLDIARYAADQDFLPSQLERAVAGVAGDARELLATEGYFAAEADVRLDRTVTPAVVRVRVAPGPRTAVRQVAVEVAGAIVAGAPAERARAAELAAGWALPAGAPFRQEAWTNAKNNLLRALLIDRYPYARIAHSQAEVDAKAAKVDLRVSVDSGPLVRFGDVQVRGLSRYAEANVRNLKPFREGEPYRQELILEYQARLQGSGYFESAVVAIDPPPTDPEREALPTLTAPVTVTVTEEPYQEIKLGAGYSTNTGFRVSVEHEHNDLLGRDYRLLSAIKLESRAQSAQAEVVTPVDRDQYSYRTLAKFAVSDIQGLSTRDASIGFGRGRKRERVDTALYGQVIYELRDASGGEENETTTATVNYSWTYRDLDSLLLPTRGYVVNLQAGGGTPVDGSGGPSFLRGYAKGALLVPLGVHAAIFRAELGRVWADTRVGVPEEFLFRAGGDQSVRGYAYQELGVREGDAIVGGRYLATASVEYVHRIHPDWGLALFVDAGNAADSVAELDPVLGYGAGVRWKSPVGAIGLDLAYGEAERQLRVHFSLGFTF